MSTDLCDDLGIYQDVLWQHFKASMWNFLQMISQTTVRAQRSICQKCYSLSDLLKFYGLMPLMITGDVAKIFV